MYTSSRDDDILPSCIASKCPTCRTCELGYLSDHIPLMVSLPTNSLNIHVPCLTSTIPPKQTLPRLAQEYEN